MINKAEVSSFAKASENKKGFPLTGTAASSQQAKVEIRYIVSVLQVLWGKLFPSIPQNR